MKIYFSGSIRGGRQDAELYQKLIKELNKFGNVLTEHIGTVESEDELTDRSIHDRDMVWLKEADVVLAEVTTPSLGVGYEIGRAISESKPIYCLYREQTGKRVSAMIKGSPDVICYSYYDMAEVKLILQDIFRDF